MRPSAALLLLALLAPACVGDAATVPPDPLAGSYVAAVSESALPLATRLTEAFAAQHPGMTWKVKDVGAAATMALLATGDADVGFLSRAITGDDERVVQVLGIGFTGQVIIVHPSNPLSGLSTAQLRGIFSGAITDWKDLGGTPSPILVVLRSDSSPTRAALDPVLRAPGTAYRGDAVEVPDAEAMLNLVSTSPRAIGMVSALHLTTASTAPRAIGIDGIAPSKSNVASGAYPYRRPISVIVPRDAARIRPGARSFRDWVHSEDGQRILRELF
ncbi:MAG: phosphate ABC transporter substrate-binding protein [Candidatus Limnocylindrales bacterium]